MLLHKVISRFPLWGYHSGLVSLKSTLDCNSQSFRGLIAPPFLVLKQHTKKVFADVIHLCNTIHVIIK
jgi:hypothetical protein